MKVYCTCGNLQYEITYYTVKVVLFWTPDEHCTNIGKGKEQESSASNLLKATIKQSPLPGNDDPIVEGCKFNRFCLIVV
jgi:hypothetical protein